MNCLVVSFSIVFTVVIAQKCVVYRKGEQLPLAPIGSRECFRLLGNTNRYCIYYNCPEPKCSNPTTPKNMCPFCDGTCVIGGKTYKFGDKFKCPDRCNSCRCTEFGVVQTKKGCMFLEPPKECRPLDFL